VSRIRKKLLGAQHARVTVVAVPKARMGILKLEDRGKAGLEIVLDKAIEPLVNLVLLSANLGSIFL
jgi:hypothetical protein